MLEAGELHVNSRKIDEDQREKIVKDAIMHILIISQDVFFFAAKLCRLMSRVSIRAQLVQIPNGKGKQTNGYKSNRKTKYFTHQLRLVGASIVSLPLKNEYMFT